MQKYHGAQSRRRYTAHVSYGKDERRPGGDRDMHNTLLIDHHRSPEAIRQEFDRLVEYTQRHFVEETNQPCVSVAQLLLRCLQKNPQQSCKCFEAMDDYRQCVMQATQRHIERLADEELQRQGRRPPPSLLPPPDNVPETNMPQPNLPLPPNLLEPNIPPTVELGASSLPRSRSWYKPWTWLQ